MAEAAHETLGGDRDRDGDAAGGGERDYGDSAGYGGGGSTLDYDELLGEGKSRRDLGRPNPLDAVVHTGVDEQEDGKSDGGTAEAARTGAANERE